MRSTLPILLCFFQVCAVWAQNSKSEKNYRLGIENLKNRNFEGAVKSFENAVRLYPAYADAHLQLGILYKNFFQNNSKALLHFEAVVAADTSYKNPMIYRVLGDIYISKGRYEQAKNYFQKYLLFTQEPIPYLQKAAINLAHCNFALAHAVDTANVRPSLLPAIVNSKRKQYFPVLTADEDWLVFTVREKNKQAEYEDIYISKKVNQKWTTPVSISENINSPYINEGTCSISANGKTLVFTICNPTPNHKTDCDLYISHRVGEVWQKPVNMGYKVNSVAWDSQPSLSPDGKTLYFSSKRAGGMGEEDIWVTTADENDIWSEPLNCGDLINTKGREVAPFFHPNLQTLFFASDYHPGFGSFDLFFCQLDSVGNWTKPLNMGPAINNHLEQSSIFVTPKGDKAYFSAEDTALKNTDRYLLYELPLPSAKYVPVKSTYAKGKISDEATGQPLAANVDLINLQTGKTVARLQSDKITGEYMVLLNENTHYALFVAQKGYLYKSHTFDFATERKFNPVTLNMALQPIQSGAIFTLNNIYFQIGEYTLDRKSYSELDRLAVFLHDNPSITVEISGHTDNVGQKQYNQELSTHRAESVVDYLLENGIQSKRIQYKGYGDTKPIAPNDEEENRKFNRRIECKIL